MTREILTNKEDVALASEVLELPMTSVHVELRRDRVRFTELLARMQSWAEPNIAFGDTNSDLAKEIMMTEKKYKSAVSAIKILSIVTAASVLFLVGSIIVALSDTLYAAVGGVAAGALVAIATSSFLISVVGLTATAFRLGRTDMSPVFGAMKIGSSLAYDVSRIMEDIEEAEKIVSDNAENSIVARQLPVEFASVRLSLKRLCVNLDSLCGNSIRRKIA